jgi:hypothetical protein
MIFCVQNHVRDASVDKVVIALRRLTAGDQLRLVRPATEQRELCTWAVTPCAAQ